MYYDAIEKSVHQVIFEQILECAKKEGYTKQGLALEIEYPKNYLSKVCKEKRFSPELAVSMMNALRFSPSQKNSVRDVLKKLNESRAIRTHFDRDKLDQLESGLFYVEDKICVCVMPIRKNSTGYAVNTIIDIEKKNINYVITELATGKNKLVEGPDVSIKYLGSKEAVDAFLGKIYQAIQIEYATITVSDLRVFDDDPILSKPYSRSRAPENQKRRMQLIEKAQAILLDHVRLGKTVEYFA